MTSIEATEPKPRHKWGWIFIVLFFIELIAFGGVVLSWKAKIEHKQSYLNTSIAYFMHIEILELNKQLNNIYLGSGIFLTATLAAAAIGFRRRKV